MRTIGPLFIQFLFRSELNPFILPVIIMNIYHTNLSLHEIFVKKNTLK